MTDNETIAAVLLRANQAGYLDLADVNKLCGAIGQLQASIETHKSAIATLEARDRCMIGVRNDLQARVEVLELHLVRIIEAPCARTTSSAIRDAKAFLYPAHYVTA